MMMEYLSGINLFIFFNSCCYFFKELDEFVSPKGFTSVIKITNKNKKITMNIDDYINELIWYSPLQCGEDKK